MTVPPSRILLCLFLIFVCTSCLCARVEVLKVENGYTLTRDGKPFVVKGAGMGNVDLATVAKRGANSIRTWGIENAVETLEKAHHLGLTVLLGLPVAAERWGMNYDDPTAIALQRETIKSAVQQFKDHPALLGWILGNELDLGTTNHGIFDEVNQLSLLVHELDTEHPTTTTLAAIDRETANRVRKRAPDLDFISLQAYGALAMMPEAIKYLREGPFMITEWGPLGHWEVARTHWDAPIEQNSAEKRRHYLSNYRTLIEPFLGPGLGSYAFYWGQKQERTPTWFSLFTESGESTAAVDALEIAWTNSIPVNQAPELQSMRLTGRSASESIRLTVSKKYDATVVALDPDGDDLTYRWQVKPESTATSIGGDFEGNISDLEGLLLGEPSLSKVTFVAPMSPGPYRLFVSVLDGKGHAAYANIPFLVDAKQR